MGSSDLSTILILLTGVVIGAAVIWLVAGPRQPVQQQVYENEETWEAVRDEKGRLLSIVVHRDVQQVI